MAPSAKPTTIASVRSRKIVSPKVTSEHRRVAPGRAAGAPGSPASPPCPRRRRPAPPPAPPAARSPRAGPPPARRRAGTAECAMPATGPCAPARTLVAVRAIVPVTQKPPKSAEPTLATPCATSSQFERCRRPVMPSATTAESSDSIAPSSVKLKRVGQHRQHLGQVDLRQRRTRKALRDAAERAADGRHRQPEQRRRQPPPARRRSASAASAAAAASAPRAPPTVASDSTSGRRVQRRQRRPDRRQLRPGAARAPARRASARGAARSGSRR